MMSVVLKLTYRFNAIPFKILAEYFYIFVCICDDTDSTNLQGNTKRSIIIKAMLKRTNLETFSLPNIKSIYKTRVIKIVW